MAPSWGGGHQGASRKCTRVQTDTPPPLLMDGQAGQVSETAGMRFRAHAADVTDRARRTPAPGPLFEMRGGRQGKQRRRCIGIDKVGPERSGEELMAGV